MAQTSKTDAVALYRKEIAAYLEAVHLRTGWKNVEMGKRAGGLSHTTIGRARKGENTLGFPSLLTLEEVSGIQIPDSLRGAAIQAQQPTRNEEVDGVSGKVDAVARDLTPAEAEELYKRLQKQFARAG